MSDLAGNMADLATIPLAERRARTMARYARVQAQLPDVLPPITRKEAEKAALRIYKKFRPMGRDTRVRARSVWLSSKPTSGDDRGWGRLIHDTSHILFRRLHPKLRPHDPRHGQYEVDIAAFVAKSGWLDGKLKPKEKVKPTGDAKRAAELVRIEARIKAWTTKHKRATTALAKLARTRKRLVARIGQVPA